MDEVNYVLNDTMKECKNKFIRSFEYRCVYEFILQIWTNWRSSVNNYWVYEIPISILWIK